MRRHTERDDIVLLTIYLEIGGLMTFMAIEDQKTIGTS
jgi:hypothetical protein